MAKNYMADVAKMLGVELEEEFMLDFRCSTYKFTENGLYFYDKNGHWWQCSNVLLPKILKGEFSIKKLPWQPKIGEEYYFPVEHFRRCGFIYWHDESRDFALKEAGMVFRTREECEVALPELRKKYLGDENDA